MTLAALNQMDEQQLLQVLGHCCGAKNWINAMAHFHPYATVDLMHEICETVWSELDDQDYLEAFTHHPMIGDLEALKKKFTDTAHWAGQEQRGSNSASEATLRALQQYNQDYLTKFGFIFIVCATGKTAEQMLNLLQERITNDPQTELAIAAREQLKITHLRLDKLLND